VGFSNSTDSVRLVRGEVRHLVITLIALTSAQLLEPALTASGSANGGTTNAKFFLSKMYDRPKRGTITVLYRVSVERRTARVQFPIQEIADLGFFSNLPGKTTPSATFFWDWQNSSIPSPS
jgi:hypothetical protein